MKKSSLGNKTLTKAQWDVIKEIIKTATPVKITNKKETKEND